jgi:peptide/nickel transport system substrate-binding protein
MKSIANGNSSNDRREVSLRRENPMSIDRRTLVKLAGASGVVLATASPAIHTAAQEATGGELIIGKSAEAVGYDPAVVTASSSNELLAVVYERLISFDENGEAQPELAESWEIVDDLTYVFTLRPGVTFHDGLPLTADDVKFTFDRIKDEATASSWASQFEPVDSIESDGDLTVTFHLNAPFGPFLATLTSVYSSIVPLRDEPVDLGATMVGTNAFKLETATADVETILTRHDGYWQEGAPVLDSLTYRILPEEAGRLAAVRTGDVHLTTLADPVSVDGAATSEGVTVLEQETTDYYLLGLNCGRAPFDNEQVRQALSKAIDRQAIVDAVFFGKGQVTGPLVPTLGDWAQPLEQLPNYEVDLEGATALLEEAGQAGLTFKILVGQLYPEFVNIALVIQDQLKEIGVTAELEQVEWGTFIDRWRERDFDAFVSFNGSGNDPDRALYPAFITDGSVNAFQYSSEELDDLLNAGRTTPDRETRKATYNQVEVAIANSAPAIFISTRIANFAVRDNVSGFQPSAAQTWDTLKNTSVAAE